MATPNDAPPEPPVFFVHVMKTGGTTLFRHLRENYPLDELYPYSKLDIRYEGQRLDIRHHLSISYLRTIPEERRRHIRVYTGHFPFAAIEAMGGAFTTMTILRDPVARTLSLLRQFRRKIPWVPEGGREPTLARNTLEEVYDHPTVFEPLVHDHQTKIFSMQPADEPESYMDVLPVDEARLAVAKANLASIDLLGVTDRYNDFLDLVEERFGWHVEREARANVTPQSDNEPVDEGLLERIRADNALDIQLYEYAKELVELRQGGRAPV
jgi:hypothetical protein